MNSKRLVSSHGLNGMKKFQPFRTTYESLCMRIHEILHGNSNFNIEIQILDQLKGSKIASDSDDKSFGDQVAEYDASIDTCGRPYTHSECHDTSSIEYLIEIDTQMCTNISESFTSDLKIPDIEKFLCILSRGEWCESECSSILSDCRDVDHLTGSTQKSCSISRHSTPEVECSYRSSGVSEKCSHYSIGVLDFNRHPLAGYQISARRIIESHPTPDSYTIPSRKESSRSQNNFFFHRSHGKNYRLLKLSIAKSDSDIITRDQSGVEVVFKYKNAIEWRCCVERVINESNFPDTGVHVMNPLSFTEYTIFISTSTNLLREQYARYSLKKVNGFAAILKDYFRNAHAISNFLDQYTTRHIGRFYLMETLSILKHICVRKVERTVPLGDSDEVFHAKGCSAIDAHHPPETPPFVYGQMCAPMRRNEQQYEAVTILLFCLSQCIGNVETCIYFYKRLFPSCSLFCVVSSDLHISRGFRPFNGTTEYITTRSPSNLKEYVFIISSIVFTVNQCHLIPTMIDSVICPFSQTYISS